MPGGRRGSWLRSKTFVVKSISTVCRDFNIPVSAFSILNCGRSMVFATSVLVTPIQFQLHIHTDDKKTDVLYKQETAVQRNKLVISFDLQQVIPVLKITLGRFVLKRRLQVKNIGIHGYGEDKSYMYKCSKDMEVVICVVDEVFSLLGCYTA